MLILPVHRSCCCNGASVVECLWDAGMANGMAKLTYSRAGTLALP